MIRSPSGRLNLVIIAGICVVGSATYDAIRQSRFVAAVLASGSPGPAVTCGAAGGAVRFAVWDERGWRP
jgi:hypothetical protein